MTAKKLWTPYTVDDVALAVPLSLSKRFVAIVRGGKTGAMTVAEADVSEAEIELDASGRMLIQHGQPQVWFECAVTHTVCAGGACYNPRLIATISAIEPRPLTWSTGVSRTRGKPAKNAIPTAIARRANGTLAGIVAAWAEGLRMPVEIAAPPRVAPPKGLRAAVRFARDSTP